MRRRYSALFPLAKKSLILGLTRRYFCSLRKAPGERKRIWGTKRGRVWTFISFIRPPSFTPGAHPVGAQFPAHRLASLADFFIFFGNLSTGRYSTDFSVSLFIFLCVGKFFGKLASRICRMKTWPQLFIICKLLTTLPSRQQHHEFLSRLLRRLMLTRSPHHPLRV